MIPIFANDIRFLRLFYVFFDEVENFIGTDNIDWRRYTQIGGENYKDIKFQGN